MGFIVGRNWSVDSANGGRGFVDRKHCSTSIAARVHVVVLRVQLVSKVVSDSHLFVGKALNKRAVEKPVLCTEEANEDESFSGLRNTTSACVKDSATDAVTCFPEHFLHYRQSAKPFNVVNIFKNYPLRFDTGDDFGKSNG